MLLENKVALVVGVKDKIGSATAETMAREGAKVVIADRNPARGRALAKKIVAAGGEAIFQELDVTLVRYQETLIKRIVAEYGRLDIAFNNVNVEGDRFWFLSRFLGKKKRSIICQCCDRSHESWW